MTRSKLKPVSAPEAGQAYAVYWSIYTDLKGRTQFRDLYWDRLKDLIGRPAKLVGIEREDLWPSGRPSPELRCHVWTFIRAASSEEAISETVRAAMRVAPGWRILTVRPEDDDETFEMVWDRPRDGAPSELPLPRLTSILASVHHDTGFRIYPGGRSAGSLQRSSRTIVPNQGRGTFAATWDFEVQTSTKRELMEAHWPILSRRFGDDGVELIDLQKRGGDVGPFRFKLRHVVKEVAQSEAMLMVLHQSEGMVLSVEDRGSSVVLLGRRDVPDRTKAHWLKSFEVCWQAENT